ncbi:MAG: hypothetical protein A2289_19920 [Deltaproteobacteria bacterium RIFOXYA12_FULL_58_15]|nr:MAG: hypothetical protein A2289_19920 [Deltaproteobacteria bacterium RIFOXYA12_FULL_58_15]OGR08886.1 MAG: hypothetical protein A2341_27550 [Deltaproteobacteria bacterium RIFOXYB12_FULL_58_9]
MAEGFFAVFAVGWSLNAEFWRTMDINGDDLRDLVQTGDFSHIETVWRDVGGDYWKVYLNTGPGFSQTHTRWPVPPAGGFVAEGFLVSVRVFSGWSRRRGAASY